MRNEQYKQNKRFRDDTKRFYRELGKKTIQIETPPDIAEVKKFWQNILEQEVKHNEDAQMDQGSRGTTANQPDGVE